MTNGVEQHPVAGLLVWSLQEEMNITLQSPPPDFDRLAASLRQRRTELIALLKKSVALNEPLLVLLGLGSVARYRDGIRKHQSPH